MFCNQCQEAAKNIGCTIQGVCGKKDATANLQDLLIYTLQGISVSLEAKGGNVDFKYGSFLSNSLFVTITNSNFDDEAIMNFIKNAFKFRDEVYSSLQDKPNHHSTYFEFDSVNPVEQGRKLGLEVFSENEDLKSLKTLLLFGLKGIAAYSYHANVLGFQSQEVYNFLVQGLASLTKDLDLETLKSLVLECGEIAVKIMALLDEANTTKFGNPEITKVNIGVKENPGILISGHDLGDMEELLKQTEGTGVDVYTHSEMLPAHYYPAFKKYTHFVGNYGSSWWKQGEEFVKFNGPILMTTNCITPVKEGYKDRIFTTGMAVYPGVKHIEEKNGKKDFSKLIEIAKKSQSPEKLEEGEIIGGFAHHEVLSLADKVVEAVKNGDITKFVVMAGCDARQNSRTYFTEIAQNLPKTTVILTAGCAKYRYNKLNLGEINGIPRILDAGQCNDSYSLAVIALKLKEVYNLNDINDLPISYDIAWYEQKAVAVLLALLYLGVKKIHLGPTLPAFLSPGVAKVLVDLFDIRPIKTVEEDLKEIV